MSQIPQRHQDFVKRIVEMAKEAGITDFSGEYQPGFMCDADNPRAGEDHWKNRIKFSWHRGRHGEPAKVHMESTNHVYADV